MKVTLISPKIENKGMQNLSVFNFPTISLNTLTSMTPLDWEVEIINENQTVIDFEKHTDLVGITAMTKEVIRAYKIADKYREKGVKVIMGGVHTSMLPEESGMHTDTVVIGEADLKWGEILTDFKEGNLKPLFICSPPANLDIIPIRRISRTYHVQPFKLLPIKAKFSYIQTQRGCPNNCEWCSVARFNGTKIRYKSIPLILKEIESLGEFDYLFVSDDNIAGNIKRAKKLFQQFKSFNFKWITQSDIRIASNELIDLACESGLSAVMLGLESIKPKTLRKSAPVKDGWQNKYEEVVKKLKGNGVIVLGTFIFGMDNDDERAIERTLEWTERNKINLAQFSIATPLPGTKLYERLMREERIRTFDWEKYDYLQCVIKHKKLNGDTIEQELKKAYQKFYSFCSILKRNGIPCSHHEFLSWATNIEVRTLFK